MTFEQLVQTAKEQETRIFSLDCALIYKTMNGFENHHFNNLKKNDIHNACREAMIKLEFPFEAIIPNVESVFSDSKNINSTKTVTGVSFKFSLSILNLPEMNLNDVKNLIYNFIETFDHVLTQVFSIPIDIKSSGMILDFRHTHTFFKVLHDNHLI